MTQSSVEDAGIDHVLLQQYADERSVTIAVGHQLRGREIVTFVRQRGGSPQQVFTCTAGDGG